MQYTTCTFGLAQSCYFKNLIENTQSTQNSHKNYKKLINSKLTNRLNPAQISDYASWKDPTAGLYYKDFGFYYCCSTAKVIYYPTVDKAPLWVKKDRKIFDCSINKLYIDKYKISYVMNNIELVKLFCE